MEWLAAKSLLELLWSTRDGRSKFFPLLFSLKHMSTDLGAEPSSTSFRFKFHLSRLWKANLKHDFVSNFSDLPNQHYYSEAQVEDKSC